MIKDIFLSIFEISVSTSLIIAALLLLAPFTNKRYAAKWNYLIWIFLSLRLMIPLSGNDWQLPAEKLAGITVSNVQQPEVAPADAPHDEAAPSVRLVVEIPEQMTAPILMQSEKSRSGLTWLDIMAFLWLGGVLSFLSVHLFSYLHYRKQIRKEGMPVGDSRILILLLKLKYELHIKRRLSAVIYPDAASPMILGFFRPILVLPEESYHFEELEFILKHELIHLKRRDIYFKLLFAAANAVHWFNPIIWLMQKEAVVDMELSCDERVVRGTDYTVKKAYTETLLSTLHKQCAGKTVFSTQFYGGKQIMKKRFQNILTRKRKKNGSSLLICAVVLAISLGTLIGCSVGETKMSYEESTGNNPDIPDSPSVPDAVIKKAEELVLGWYADAKASFAEHHYNNWRIDSLEHCYTYESFENMMLQVYQMNYEFLSDTPENVPLAGGMEMTEDGWVTPDYPDSNFLVFWQNGNSLSFLADMFENDCVPGDEMFTEDLKRQLGYAAALTFTVEGMQTEQPATLSAGDGYSIYLTDGDWRQTAPDCWAAVLNDEVLLWVSRFEGSSLDQVKAELSADGYQGETFELAKQEGSIQYKVRLRMREAAGDVWGVFYCYPDEAEEGWGNVLPTIVDTFSVTDPSSQQSLGVPVTILAYIEAFDGRKLSFDAAEYVTVPGGRAAELGITEDDAPSGFYIYNEDNELKELLLAPDCICTVLDWTMEGGTYERREAAAGELPDILEERKAVRDLIPYHLTIQNGEILKIVEQYVP